jgi:enamine deaminase RidA (YjgF/YER057c/UK114 family)
LASDGFDASRMISSRMYSCNERSYVVDHDFAKLQALGEAERRIWGDQPPTQTLLGVASLALPGMLFEVDALAVRQP